MNMGLQTKVGRAVLDLGDIIKTNVVGDIARARSEKKLALTEADLNTLANIVTASIEKTVRAGEDGITRLIKD